MNYIREINAFFNELEINPLSSSAISLWHALLHLNNRSGWKESFSVPVGTLALKSGLSERTIFNARNELKTKGYISFQSKSGNRSAVYTLNRLSANNAYNYTDNDSDKPSESVSDKGSDNPSALKDKRKRNETKGNKPPVSPKSNYADFVTLTPEEYEKLITEHGEPAVKEMIEILNSYKAASGKKYKSDYHTMTGRGWVLDRYRKEHGQKVSTFKPRDPELEARRREIAFNKWISEGNDPNAFVYRLDTV